MNETELFSWVLSGVGAVIVSLSGTVVVLFKLHNSAHETTVAKLNARIMDLADRADKCDQDRRQLHIENARLEERIRILEQKHDRN